MKLILLSTLDKSSTGYVFTQTIYNQKGPTVTGLQFY